MTTTQAQHTGFLLAIPGVYRAITPVVVYGSCVKFDQILGVISTNEMIGVLRRQEFRDDSRTEGLFVVSNNLAGWIWLFKHDLEKRLKPVIVADIAFIDA